MVDFRKAYAARARVIRKSLEKVLESGVYVLGENVEKFEKEFASFSGGRYGVGVASGTDALTLSMMALGIKQGDQVVTVANTASPTVMAIVNSGARPVIVEPSPSSFLMDTSHLGNVLSPRTKAIVPVHLYGNPCDMENLVEFSTEHDLLIVEDCAQAHGATFRGRPVGSYGTVGCYSFYPTKNLGGFGDGGMIVTKSYELAQRLRALRMYGMSGEYSSLERGLCSRLDEIQAATLRSRLRYLSGDNERRRENARRYKDLLAEVPGVGIQEETAGGVHVYHQFVVTIKNREKIRKELAKCGIGTGVHYPVAICDQPAFRKYSSPHQSYPISRALAKMVLSLPVHPFLERRAIPFVVSAIARAIDPTS